MPEQTLVYHQVVAENSGGRGKARGNAGKARIGACPCHGVLPASWQMPAPTTWTSRSRTVRGESSPRPYKTLVDTGCSHFKANARLGAALRDAWGFQLANGECPERSSLRGCGVRVRVGGAEFDVAAFWPNLDSGATNLRGGGMHAVRVLMMRPPL